MAWILVRTFVITPLMLIMAALILLTLGLQALAQPRAGARGEPTETHLPKW